MITIKAAHAKILDGVVALPVERFALSDALGLVLGEAAVADVDMPPFDKAAVDGYAVVAADGEAGSRFAVIEQVTAGRTATQRPSKGKAVHIMTGAPVPVGTAAIVMVEHTRAAGESVEVTRTTAAGKNICKQGEDLRAGAAILEAGTRLSTVHLAVLASQGQVAAACHRRPVVATLATGDEVVSPEETPEAGQIRNANNVSLMGQAQSAGARTFDLGISPDHLGSLTQHIREGLRADIVLCSGGVSAGTLDLVPEAMKAAGVEEVFHHVGIQPGRPMCYGRWRNPDENEVKHVFGLAGNPVATFVCFEVFIRPLIDRLMGITEVMPRTISVRFEGRFKATDARERYVGVRLQDEGGEMVAHQVATHGPADVAALSRCDGLAILPANSGPIERGTVVQVLRLG
jgi:molybdopterin molybdotransferase